MSLFEHPAFDNHEHIAFRFDEKTGLKAIIAVHNTNLGPTLGGCRMWPYASSAEALNDVLRLSRGMTYKSALANLPQGGGKSVIIGDPRTDITPALMHAMGDFVQSLGGKYVTAEDSGISPQSLKLMAQRCDYVAGTQAKYSYHGGEADGNPSPATAYGTFVGIQASVKQRLGRSVDGLTVAIQGLGHVGYRLAELLHAAGANLIVTDIFPDNLEKAEKLLGATVVKPEAIYAVKADVFAPCAFGAVINDDNIEQFNFSVIAGAANNQLAHESHGEILRQRDILYAPDYVINAGGVIDIYHQNIDSSNAALRTHIEQIGETLTEIFMRSQQQGDATNIVANLMAEERFSAK